LDRSAERWRRFRDTGYSVSSLGRVRSPRGKILKQKRQKNGYMRVSLGSKEEQFVHRMVLIAFRGEPPSPLHESDHENKRRDANWLGNLHWLEKPKNLAQRDLRRGESHGNAKVTEAEVILIRSGPFYRGRDGIVAADLGISREQVRDIRLGKNWAHIGGL
jgi:hypothetical protein